MYRTTDDFLTDYREEGHMTLACLKELTDDALSQAVSEQDRTLGQIAWHITTSVGGFAKIAQIKFEGVDFESPMPETADEIVAAYEKTLNSTLAGYASLSDDDLTEQVDFFGYPMSRGMLLYKGNTHQIHHRGQMTVLMRQAELRVPGLYGPSRDSE